MKQICLSLIFVLGLSCLFTAPGQQPRPIFPQQHTSPETRLPADGLTFLGHNGQNFAHLMDVEIAGDKAYVLVGVYNGLETYDISNPAQPLRVHQDGPSAWGAKSYGDRLYTFNRHHGFRIYNIAGAVPVFLGKYDPSNIETWYENGVLHGTDLYVAAHQQGIEVFDVSNEVSPAYGGNIQLADNACWDVEFHDSYLLVANGRYGLSVVDLSQPQTEVAILPLPGLANHIVLDGDVAFITLGDSGVATVDVSSPPTPVLLDTAATGGNAFGCGLNDHQVAVGSWRMLEIYDIGDPGKIKRVGWDHGKTWAMGADLEAVGTDRLVAIADWRGMSVYRPGADPAPDIDVTPAHLDFGPVTSVKKKRAQVRNTGTASLQVSLGSLPSGITVDSTSFSLAPGAVRTLEVTASGAGTTSSAITYLSNDPDEASWKQYVYKNNSSFPQVDDPAPDFTVQDVDGVWHTLSHYRGKVVYLEFGGLW